MAKPTMIAFSVGVADDVLLEIGRLVVLGAQIDYHRMRLLEVMANTPIAESANIPISRLTGRLKSAAAEPPFDRIRDDLRHWLNRSSDLLRIRHEIAHSFGGREVRGDGTARDVRLYPRHGKDQTQFAPERLREFVLRMLEATQDGAILEIQAGILRKRGYAGHDAWRQQQEAYEEAKRRLMEHGTISEQGGAEDDG